MNRSVCDHKPLRMHKICFVSPYVATLNSSSCQLYFRKNYNCTPCFAWQAFQRTGTNPHNHAYGYLQMVCISSFDITNWKYFGNATLRDYGELSQNDNRHRLRRPAQSLYSKLGYVCEFREPMWYRLKSGGQRIRSNPKLFFRKILALNAYEEEDSWPMPHPLNDDSKGR